MVFQTMFISKPTPKTESNNWTIQFITLKPNMDSISLNDVLFHSDDVNKKTDQIYQDMDYVITKHLR